MKDLFLQSRFYYAMSMAVVTYILIYVLGRSIWIGHVILITVILMTLYDYFILRKVTRDISAVRLISDQLSLSDSQYVKYKVKNEGPRPVIIELLDELPYQLQQRKFLYNFDLREEEMWEKDHNIKPVKRGLYQFGKLHLYVSHGFINFLQKRVSFDIEKDVEVIPSYLQMKKYDLEIFNSVSMMSGIKRIRRIGRTDEFEQIKNYTQGDNIKSINWKATSRKNEIMVNQYQDTRSQSVYCVIDKGRSMKMPFDHLALLDYAINSTLVLSNVCLKKYDRVGLVTFNNEINTILPADNRSGQISKISRLLYNQETGYLESNYQALYLYIRKMITRRSIMIMFSNFENLYDMRRALPYLRQLNKRHLLVIIFFTNTELVGEADREVHTVSDIYDVTFAKRALVEKDMIAEELRRHGIQTILSKPEELSINVINKYLEIKAKRMS